MHEKYLLPKNSSLSQMQNNSSSKCLGLIVILILFDQHIREYYNITNNGD